MQLKATPVPRIRCISPNKIAPAEHTMSRRTPDPQRISRSVKRVCVPFSLCAPPPITAVQNLQRIVIKRLSRHMGTLFPISFKNVMKV